ncbi:TetR/AcrR family transcriptional regulator [Kutzneria sp. CA-103260]|uniref:TetR/AcrR family transcriptional regulator n=1 Tax=Kutzneria sp. CA-103260 TaxID=2802641 RepID=UPI001BA84C2F|nr:TetR/AcrR family transcriptional regulator [Kutzneria sp. CA-103260]QUQ67236.1 HTH-type transcriptional repressor FabR [Kutzneria sp. CA-103260]
MASSRAEQAERTRKTVLDTARRLFAERGFDGTSLQLIADTMGVQKANVYYYFRTKMAILEALLEGSIAAFEQTLAAAERLDGLARKEFLVDGFVDQVVASRSMSPLSRIAPTVRREGRIGEALRAQTARGLRLMFGDEPTVEQQAAYYMATDVGPVVPRMKHLSDAELRDLLRRLCLRILDV